MKISLFILALLGALPLAAANRVSVTVVDAKSGKPALGLKAEDFTLFEDKLARKVDAAEFSTDVVDVMLLLVYRFIKQYPECQWPERRTSSSDEPLARR